VFLALASTSSPNPDAPTGFDNKSNGMADDTTVLHFLFPETDFCFSLYVHSGRFSAIYFTARQSVPSHLEVKAPLVFIV